MAEAEPSLGPDAIRAALERVLASADFDASERNRNFLRHVVEETLAGRAERIKAYNIATTVFGRDDRFDPQLDSIVRIEAGRLRRSLERYYLTSGRDDPVRIGVPKGSYVPTFEERGQGSIEPSAVAAARGRWGRRCSSPPSTRRATQPSSRASSVASSGRSSSP